MELCCIIRWWSSVSAVLVVVVVAGSTGSVSWVDPVGELYIGLGLRDLPSLGCDALLHNTTEGWYSLFY